MKTHVITRKQLDSNNNYIGKVDLTNFNGHIETEENLGIVIFSSVCVTGYIYFKAGCGIKAGWGIEAGYGIKAGCGIKAGDGIKAGRGIKAGNGIEAGRGIKAGNGIEAGWGIEAGDSIKAGCGIEAGYGINCKFELSAGKEYNIFAGNGVFIKTSNKYDIICGKLVSGNIAYGNLKEIGLLKDKKIQVTSMSGKVVKVEIDGVNYEAVLK
jgi:hypothetical protein